MMIKWTAGLAAVCAAVAVVGVQSPAAGRPHGSGLARFYDQKLAWGPCQADPDDETGAELDRPARNVQGYWCPSTTPTRRAGRSGWRSPGCRRATRRTGSAHW